MSTVVNVWMGELTKLTDKIRLKNNNQKQPHLNFFIRSRNEADDQIEEQEESGMAMAMMNNKPVSVMLKSPTENQLPEEAVFWLMDRFAPC